MAEKSAFDVLNFKEMRRLEHKGKKYVAIEKEQFEKFLERVEDLEDLQIVHEVFDKDIHEGRDPFEGGIPWEQVKKELEADEHSRNRGPARGEGVKKSARQRSRTHSARDRQPRKQLAAGE